MRGDARSTSATSSRPAKQRQQADVAASSMPPRQRAHRSDRPGRRSSRRTRGRGSSEMRAAPARKHIEPGGRAQLRRDLLAQRAPRDGPRRESAISTTAKSAIRPIQYRAGRPESRATERAVAAHHAAPLTSGQGIAIGKAHDAALLAGLARPFHGRAPIERRSGSFRQRDREVRFRLRPDFVLGDAGRQFEKTHAAAAMPCRSRTRRDR